MDLNNLDEWTEYCRSVEGRSKDESVAGGGWIVSGSTPPPTIDDPLARVPVERARDLRLEAKGRPPGTERDELLSTALAWTKHPHPASSSGILDQLAGERRRVESMLEE